MGESGFVKIVDGEIVVNVGDTESRVTGSEDPNILEAQADVAAGVLSRTSDLDDETRAGIAAGAADAFPQFLERAVEIEPE